MLAIRAGIVQSLLFILLLAEWRLCCHLFTTDICQAVDCAGTVFSWHMGKMVVSHGSDLFRSQAQNTNAGLKLYQLYRVKDVEITKGEFNVVSHIMTSYFIYFKIDSSDSEVLAITFIHCWCHWSTASVLSVTVSSDVWRPLDTVENRFTDAALDM